MLLIYVAGDDDSSNDFIQSYHQLLQVFTTFHYTKDECERLFYFDLKTVQSGQKSVPWFVLQAK